MKKALYLFFIFIVVQGEKCVTDDNIINESNYFDLNFVLINPIADINNNNNNIKSHSIPKDLVEIVNPFTSTECDSALFYSRPIANIERVDVKKTTIIKLNRETTFEASPFQDSINFMKYIKELELSKEWFQESDSTIDKFFTIRNIISENPDAEILAYKGEGAYLSKVNIKNMENVQDLRQHIINKICKNPATQFYILFKPKFSIEIEPLDTLLTTIKNTPDKKRQDVEYKKLESDLLNKVKEEPDDWFSLYLLARNQLLAYGNNPNSKKKATDYLVKSANEAIKKKEAANLTFYLNKYKQEAFKELFEEESILRAIIEGTRIGLEKNDLSYVGTPINFLYINNKGLPTVNIDPDKIYIHLGTDIPDKFRISIYDFDNNSGTFKLNFTYPHLNGQDDIYQDVYLDKHSSKTFEITNKNFEINLVNQTEVGRPFASIGVLKVKKKIAFEDYSPNINQSPVIEKPNNFDGLKSPNKKDLALDPKIKIADSDMDGFADNIDNCPKRSFKKNNGCPELIIKASVAHIYENESFNVSIDFEDLPKDQIKWESISSIVGSTSLNPSLKIAEVGRYPISVSITNPDDHFSAQANLDIYVEIRANNLEKHFLKIANYGNLAVLGAKMAPEVRIEANESERKILAITQSDNISMVKDEVVYSTLVKIISELKNVKHSAETNIDSFSITHIGYDKSTGKINSIHYSLK